MAEEGNIVRSADLMALQLKEPDVAQAVAADPARADRLAAGAKAATDATFAANQQLRVVESDRKLYRIATVFLGSLAMVAAGGIILIALAPAIFKIFGSELPDLSIPDGLVAISSTAVGALAGLLSPLGGGRS